MTQIQPSMIIAGIPEDQVFSHICYVANHLSQMLPNFQFKRISKQREEWEPWLKKVCDTHNWSHSGSLLVWRKFGKRPGAATYIGGATQFWEFISEYYGIESRLTKDELKTLSQDFLQETHCNLPENTSRISKDKRLVAIFGENKSLCSDLAVELLLIEELHLVQGILIQICDAQLHEEKPDEQIENISEGSAAVKIVQSMNAALIDCDLLVVLNEILREDGESTDEWLTRNRVATLELAAQINEHAPAHLRVIFCSNGPTCFNAGVLAVASTKLDTDNIVAVGGHEGLNILNEILKLVDVPSEEIGCPPVWGFLGVSRFTDICNAVQKHHIFRPNDRALKSPQGTTLPLGVKQPDLRSIFYLSHNKNPYLNIFENKVAEAVDFQKCKAICDLVKLWYNESYNSTNSEIISLGIRSDGTFGIPKGIFFSQPVYLKEMNTDKKSRQWVPCSEFPVPNNPSWILSSMIETAKILVQKYIDPELLIATIPATIYEDISQGDIQKTIKILS